MLLAITGVGVGSGCLRLRNKGYWSLGYFAPLLLLLLTLPGAWWEDIELAPPFSWATTGRTEEVICALAGPWLFTTLITRLDKWRLKWLAGAVAVLFFAKQSLQPFVATAQVRDYLGSLKTTIDLDGVCRQSIHYTCGPASAVTALRQLGLPAEEGQLAIWAHSNPLQGTPTARLAQTLRKHYGPRGLSCQFRRFDSIEELAHSGVTLAVVKLSTRIDHMVAVLQVTDRDVVIGDPLVGKTVLTHDQFRNRWRFLGVALRKCQSRSRTADHQAEAIAITQFPACLRATGPIPISVPLAAHNRMI